MLDGVLLLVKPAGWSSNQALQRVKRVLNAQKAGHTGTLDPFATGLLICCFGKMTKLAHTMLHADKVYEATITWGVQTDSGDLTGQPTARAPTDFIGIARPALEAVLADFRGLIEQIPPMHSALKRDGKPLYAYARQGVEVERAARQVHIHELTVMQKPGDTGNPDAPPAMQTTIRVHCSKGTYIRTLAQDIGQRLGCYGHLSALRRTRIPPFDLAQAWTLEALDALPDPKSALMLPAQLPAELLAAARQPETPSSHPIDRKGNTL